MNFSGCLAGAALLLSGTAAVAATVPPELWDRPRSAAAVMAQDVIRQAVADHHARKGSRLVIVHGVRQEALLQAEELRAWLVALAVDSARLELRADPAATGLRIEVSE
jgi:hypothetical protein